MLIRVLIEGINERVVRKLVSSGDIRLPDWMSVRADRYFDAHGETVVFLDVAASGKSFEKTRKALEKIFPQSTVKAWERSSR